MIDLEYDSFNQIFNLSMVFFLLITVAVISTYRAVKKLYEIV